MPYRDPEKQREATYEPSRIWKEERYQNDEAFRLAEKKRKAKWYVDNKEKKAEAQRRYRARKRAEKNL